MNNKTWYAKNSGGSDIHGQGLIIDEKTGENIAIVYKKENAPLLSAAPDMAEVLTFMVEEFEECHRNNQEIEHQEESGDAMRLHREEEPDCSYCAAIRQAREALRKAGR